MSDISDDRSWDRRVYALAREDAEREMLYLRGQLATLDGHVQVLETALSLSQARVYELSEQARRRWEPTLETARFTRAPARDRAPEVSD